MIAARKVRTADRAGEQHISHLGEAGLAVEGPGAVVEWAVRMERLPEEATLRHRLQAGAVGPEPGRPT